MARLRAPGLRGTLLCLAAGVAFSVSPILIQVAYAHGAAVTRRPRLALPRGDGCCSSGSRAARCFASRSEPLLGAFALGAVVYALDSALFYGSLERTSAPLASLVHYAHLVLVVGRRRDDRPRAADAPAASSRSSGSSAASLSSAAPPSNPDLVGIGMALGSAAAYAVYILLSDRLLRDADPMALAAYLTAGAATSFVVAGRRARLPRQRSVARRDSPASSARRSSARSSR